MKTLNAGILFLIRGTVMAQTTYKTILVDSAYKITVPEYMVEVNDLVEGPALQMKYLGESPLLLTVRAEKKTLINALDSGFTHPEYYNYIAAKVAAKLVEPQISDVKTDMMQGTTFMEGQVRGTFQGTRLGYFIRTIGIKDYYCQIDCWTEVKSIIGTLVGSSIVQIRDSFQIIHE
jgi:hypothetical protein